MAVTVYFDFNVAHCHEMLMGYQRLTVRYSTFYAWCQKAGIKQGKRRRPSKRRLYRERMANEGLMLQMDGSHHPWNGMDEWCLIGLIDDATSDMPAARFYPKETTWGCMKTLRLVIERKGFPEVNYTDEAGWAGGSEKRRYLKAPVPPLATATVPGTFEAKPLRLAVMKPQLMALLDTLPGAVIVANLLSAIFATDAMSMIVMVVVPPVTRPFASIVTLT
jgi:hypothetical protein